MLVQEEIRESAAIQPVRFKEGLVNLWDIMRRIAANDLVHTGRVLQTLAGHMNATFAAQVPITPENNDILLAELRKLKSDCDSLELTCSADLLAWIIDDYSNTQHTYGEVRSTVELLSASYQQELSRNWFMFVESGKAAYFRTNDEAFSRPALGFKTSDAFPSSVRDMVIAGNCFGCGFNDSCVFHLMRVLETALGALARVFSVPFKHENWNTIIEQVESKIRAIDPTTPDWRTKKKFYSGAALEFMFFKDAWRNYAIHGRESYDSDRAKNIYEHVSAFMKHLADGGLTE